MMADLIELLHTYWTNLQAAQLPQIGAWSYVLLAVLVAVEGPIFTLVGASAASTGLMRPWLVFAAAAAGNLTADLLWYTLGYIGRIEWILRYGRWLGVRRQHLDRLQAEMRQHAPKILILAKLSAGFVIPTLIAAGLAKVNWRRWLPALSLAETIWTGSLVLIGFYATQAIQQVERGIEFVVVIASIIFLLVMLFGIRRILRKNPSVAGPEEDTQKELE